MNKTFAVAAAALVALTPAASFARNNYNSGTPIGDDADLIWRGDLTRSCSIEATQEGTLALSPDNKWLESKDVEQAHLDYVATGPSGTSFTIKATDSSVTLDGTEQLGDDAAERVEVNYNEGQGWDQVYQGNQNTFLDNQRGQSIDGSGTLEVDVKTNAHYDRSNQSVRWGNYVVRTTVACFVK